MDTGEEESMRGPDHVQLPYLETFAQAAEQGSFTGAARALGMTQAAVSQRIQALEKELGTSLFRRQAGSVLLSDAGRRLYEYAQRILDLHRSARESIAGQKGRGGRRSPDRRQQHSRRASPAAAAGGLSQALPERPGARPHRR
jgi:DNA-binding transcriptional LysR family regulator